MKHVCMYVYIYIFVEREIYTHTYTYTYTRTNNISCALKVRFGMYELCTNFHLNKLQTTVTNKKAHVYTREIEGNGRP